MPETTHTPDSSNTPDGFAYCAWHQGYARGARLIRVHEQGSGPGGGLFACPPCRQEHDLVPLADQPL